MAEKLKRFVESVGRGLSYLGLLLAPLLYFMLKRKSQELAAAESKAKVSEAEKHVEKAQEQAATSAADYASKRAEYERLRGEL